VQLATRDPLVLPEALEGPAWVARLAARARRRQAALQVSPVRVALLGQWLLVALRPQEAPLATVEEAVVRDRCPPLAPLEAT